MSNGPLAAAGAVIAFVGLVGIGSELLLGVYIRVGRGSGGLVPRPGESPSALLRRNVAENDRQRATLARLRPWLLILIVAGLVLLMISVLV